MEKKERYSSLQCQDGYVWFVGLEMRQRKHGNVGNQRARDGKAGVAELEGAICFRQSMRSSCSNFPVSRMTNYTHDYVPDHVCG